MSRAVLAPHAIQARGARLPVREYAKTKRLARRAALAARGPHPLDRRVLAALSGGEALSPTALAAILEPGRFTRGGHIRACGRLVERGQVEAVEAVTGGRFHPDGGRRYRITADGRVALGEVARA